MALFSWVPIFVDWTKMTLSWGSKLVVIVFSLIINTENYHFVGTGIRGSDPPQNHENWYPTKYKPSTVFAHEHAVHRTTLNWAEIMERTVQFYISNSLLVTHPRLVCNHKYIYTLSYDLVKFWSYSCRILSPFSNWLYLFITLFIPSSQDIIDICPASAKFLKFISHLHDYLYKSIRSRQKFKSCSKM